MLKQALYYHSIGLNVIPASKDKIPLIKWGLYKEKKVTKQDIVTWWTKFKNANIACVLGKVSNNLIVIDIDIPQNIEKIKKIVPTFNTPTVKTHRGFHLYYRMENPTRSKIISPGIDIKGENSIVLLPPSKHPSGTTYQWYKGRTLETLKPALLNDMNVQNTDPLRITEMFLGVTKGNRNISLTRIAGILFKNGLTFDEVYSIVKKWNALCNPPLSEEEIEKTLRSIYTREINLRKVINSIVSTIRIPNLKQQTEKVSENILKRITLYDLVRNNK